MFKKHIKLTKEQMTIKNDEEHLNICIKFPETENIIIHIRNSECVTFNEFVKNTMNVLNSRLDTSKNGIDKQQDRTEDYTEYTAENQRDRKYESGVNFYGDRVNWSGIYLIGVLG